MPRKSAPWYWESRNSWWIKIDGRKHNLGDHPKGAPKPKKKGDKWNVPKPIEKAFHKFMLERPDLVTSGQVVSLLDEFLEWTKQNREPKTYKGYLDFCQSFLKKWPHLATDELKPLHVQEWINEKDTWSSTTKRGAITAIKRALNWGVRMQYIPANPIAMMEKPEAKSRTTIVTEEEFNTILEHVPDDNFRDLLIVSYDCGCRPIEVKQLEARHVNLEQNLWILPTKEAKGKKKPRVVYIPTERSLDIIRKRIEQHTEGPVFRNKLGNAWTANAVKDRFADLDHVLGKRVRQYDLRHGWITRKIIAGVDSHVVATLAGHTNTNMVDTVYSHAAQNHEFMLKQARRDIKAEDAEASS